MALVCSILFKGLIFCMTIVFTLSTIFILIAYLSSLNLPPSGFKLNKEGELHIRSGREEFRIRWEISVCTFYINMIILCCEFALKN